MILTTTRHGRSSRDVRNLGAHLAKQVGQTARVVKIGNCPVGNADDAYRYMVAMRDGSQATVAMHHITISPRRALTEQELDQAVGQVLSAMGAEDHAYVLHHHAEKARAGAEVEDHYHLVLGHVGPDCRALDDRDSYARLEAVARVLEVDFGEELTHSRRTRQVADRLREMGRADVADRLPQPEEPPRSAMNSTRRAAAARAGIDLPKAKVEIAAAWAAADGPAAFRSALREQGFDVAAGSKPGVYVVTHEGVEIGALDRLVREKRAAVAARMEVQHVQPAQPAKGFIAEALAAREARSSTGDLPGGPRGEGARGEASAAPRAPRAEGGGRPAGPDRGAEDAPRADPSRATSSADGDRRSDGPRGSAARDEAARQVRRAAAVARLRRIDVSGLLKEARELALSPAERTRRQLQDRLADARDRIRRAAASIPEPATLAKARLHAAAAAKESGRAFEQATAAENRVALVAKREPRGLFAFLWRSQWKREFAAVTRSHDVARAAWREASEARTAARRALDQEERRAAAFRRPIELQHEADGQVARRDQVLLQAAEAVLRDRPGLAALGVDRVVEIARQRIEEEERRRDQEARRQAFAAARAAPREPAPAGPRFG